MKIRDLFATPVSDKIEPVIKVGERQDERKLASEVSSYVVTPTIERYLDDMLEHWTDTLRNKTTEIGIWISGYFGSGKSHFAKIFSLLVSNPSLDGVSTAKRFEARLPANAPHRDSILRSLTRVNECETTVLAFNLNTLADSKKRPLPMILLSQYYLSRGYSSNVIYARVIESEIDKLGKLSELHNRVEQSTKKTWEEVQNNPTFYRKALYDAACEVAPEHFRTHDEVDRALTEAQRGELYNVNFLIRTVLDDLQEREARTKREQRLLFVLDESGQWIEDDSGKLSQLQALVEEAAVAGQGKVWLIVTTHGDMGSIFKEARALEGDMKKIEGRFRFKPALTTENIELVLEDRLFRKTAEGKATIEREYESRGSGMVRGLGELANVTSRSLPVCTPEKFSTYYPFFPYQIHLIPEIVKSLRSKGGRGEQMSGSTRTLLAITQDILRSGRRPYLDDSLGALVSYDELYHNLAGEGEVSPDVRTDISRITGTVPDATDLTRRVAEVLFLIRELPFIPRTLDNIARLLVEGTDEDLAGVVSRIRPELERLRGSGLVGQTGDEFEFLTGERRSFEEDVARIEIDFRQQDRERGLLEEFIYSEGKAKYRDWIDSNSVVFHNCEFPFKISVDEHEIVGLRGDVRLKLYTPLSNGRVNIQDLENKSLLQDMQETVFFMSGRVNGFDRDLQRYMAMLDTIRNWVSDPQKSEDARMLADERSRDDVPKLRRRVIEGLKEGIRSGYLIFRGSSRQLTLKPGTTPSQAIRYDMASYWPRLYPKFDRVPVRITSDQRAIKDVLSGDLSSATQDVRSLRLFDKAGKIDLHSPLLDGIKMMLSSEQRQQSRILGGDLIGKLSGIGYGWDPNAVRVGVAALVRAGVVTLVIGQKNYTNAGDPEVAKALLNNRDFAKVELILEDTDVDPDILTEVRKLIIKLASKRKIDETPSAVSEEAEGLGRNMLDQAESVVNWASGSGLPLPIPFTRGVIAWQEILQLKNPIHRINSIHSDREALESGFNSVLEYRKFHKEQSVVFKQMSDEVASYAAIEYRQECDPEIRDFLREYRVAKEQASFANADTWSSLQSARNQAALAIKPLLERWRSNAQTTIENAIGRLAVDLREHVLPESLAVDLTKPLSDFIHQIPSVTSPAQVAALDSRAQEWVKSMGQRIVDEARLAKKEPDSVVPMADQNSKHARAVKPLRATDVSTVTRVTDVDQWEAYVARLDKRVRQLLADGYDVELG